MSLFISTSSLALSSGVSKSFVYVVSSVGSSVGSSCKNISGVLVISGSSSVSLLFILKSKILFSAVGISSNSVVSSFTGSEYVSIIPYSLNIANISTF